MLPSVKRILYATELTDSSISACHYAIYLAKLTGAEIHILHVTERISPEMMVALEGYIMNSEARKKTRQSRNEVATKKLKKRLDKFWKQQEPDVQKLKKKVASVNVYEAYPAEEILKQSSKLNCDMIVMGAHDKGVIHTFLGSVAKSVLRRARIPVLIVPIPEGDTEF